MILTVPISAEILTECLTTGYEIYGKRLRVTQGLPPGAKLVGCSMSGVEFGVHLIFDAPGEESAGGVLPIILNKDQELDELERLLAEAGALCSVDCVVIREEDGGETWLRIDDGDREDLAEELRYLELIGRLEKHPNNPGLVRILPDPQAELQEAAS